MSKTWWESADWLAYEAAGGYPSRVEELTQATWQTRVIDLSVSEADLWRGIRRSYKSLVHRAEERYELALWSSHGACMVARCLHELEAGRETRPVETWGMMQDWLQTGSALLIGAENERYGGVAYAYFNIHGRWAYYFSAASLEPNVNHALIWHAMKALKARGVRWLELGWQGEAHDEKGRQIEFFRAGWGGFDMPASEAPKLAFAEQQS